MSSTTCAYCRALSHVTTRWAGFVDVKRRTLVQGAATCDNCGRASIGFRALVTGEVANYPERKIDDIDQTLQWYPEGAVAPDFPDVPDAIAHAAREAHAAHSIGVYMAAILMARTVVEASAKLHQIVTGSLFTKIDKLKSEDLIRASTADAAHEIRHFGNDMAHGDIDDQPSREDAADVLALMDELLRELFQGPAIAARIKAKREGIQ